MKLVLCLKLNLLDIKPSCIITLFQLSNDLYVLLIHSNIYNPPFFKFHFFCIVKNPLHFQNLIKVFSFQYSIKQSDYPIALVNFKVIQIPINVLILLKHLIPFPKILIKFLNLKLTLHISLIFKLF
jgi:hypothetical protein